MKKCYSLLLLSLLPWMAATAQRSVTTLREGWQFRMDQDSAWHDVAIPHDFQIGQPWVAPSADERADNSDPGANRRSRLSSRGFKEMGVGWYRLHFTPADSLRDRRVLLDFEGMMLVGDAWLNNEKIGQTDYGYLGFEADVSKLLRFGQDNVLTVRCDTREPANSRWYTGGGLFRDVHLVVTHPRLYLTRHPLHITTKVEADGAGTVSVDAELTAPFDSKTKNLRLTCQILDADGNRVDTTGTLTPAYRAGQKTREYHLADIRVAKPQLWSCETPYLYTAVVTLYDQEGRVADRVSSKFGIRTLEFSPEFGLKLNGKKVLLKGIANHHTLGALGAAAWPDAMEARIRMLKAFGFNHIRTSHNPYSESLLDLCDRYGILVVDELYDKWLTQYAGGRTQWTLQWQHDLPEWVRRDRNHPSVVMWSLGNELQTYWDIPYADWGVTPYRLQKTLLRRYDETRPVTVAMHPRGRDPEDSSLPAPLARETDVASYNYRYMYFPGDGERYPWMMFYQSEANTSMLGPNWFEMDLDKVIGAAYWGMIDYLGESQGWPQKGWAQGVFDISLQPKPSAYLCKAMFSDQPTVHIGVFESGGTQEWNGIRTGINRMSENWNREAGTPLTLYTYTNCDEVELLLNGRSLGVKRNNKDNPKERCQIRWDSIAYAQGTLEAIGRTGGKVAARHQLETTGEAAALRIEPLEWASDTASQLCQLRLTAVDKQGRRVLGASHEVRLAVEGDAELQAIGNGDISTSDLFVGDRVHLFEGSALVILRLTDTAASRTPFHLTATATGLKAASYKERTRKR